ncbi:ABC transporter permease [Streptomyces phaeochromogenes]|uniref:ABC transporter permease n=1 Tax=Streptomyces phaeochromogenes TaxID=1923 RepID=UPI0033FD735E
MSRSGQAFGTALWFALVGHGRNRLALVLALGFMPLWIWLMRLCTMEADMRFKVPASGGDLVANSNHVSQLVGAMNAVTFLIGFTMFMSTFKSVELDRRLVLAGYPRTQLLLAKVVALQLIAALVATYAVAILGFWWPVRHWWALVLAVFAAANVYGGLGILLGSLLRRELEGMFIMIMASIIDLGVQNPTMNPLSGQALLPFLPLYGPMQASFTAGFAPATASRYLLSSALWFVLTTTAGLAVFWFRTRAYPRTRAAGRPRTSEAACHGIDAVPVRRPRSHH